MSPESVEAWEMFAFRLWVPYFKSSTAITAAALEDYKRARLRDVTRSTVLKEFSALRRFLGWLRERGFETPDVPSIPKRAAGGRAIERPLVVLTAAEAEAVIAKLPERTDKGNPARAFYRVLWETGLRRGTLRRLSTPEHYRRGAGELVIDARIDKSRYGRTVPITPAATAALDAVLPRKPGLIFGSVRYRHTLAKAARAAGIAPDRAAHVGDHSFRHARTTALLEAGASLVGVAYLMGHKHLTTTNAYVHARREAAEEALAAGVKRATKRATARKPRSGPKKRKRAKRR